MPAREFADATQRTIDSEVAALVRAAETTAVELLREHSAQLDQLIDLLLEEENIDGSRVYELVGKPVPDQTSALRAKPRRIDGLRLGVPADTAPVEVVPDDTVPAEVAPEPAPRPVDTAPGPARRGSEAAPPTEAEAAPGSAEPALPAAPPSPNW
jgi:hypothetical protein